MEAEEQVEAARGAPAPPPTVKTVALPAKEEGVLKQATPTAVQANPVTINPRLRVRSNPAFVAWREDLERRGLA